MLKPSPDASAKCRKIGEFFVGPGEFGSPFLDPPFQFVVGLLQRLFGPLSLRDVVAHPHDRGDVPRFIAKGKR